MTPVLEKTNIFIVKTNHKYILIFIVKLLLKNYVNKEEYIRIPRGLLHFGFASLFNKGGFLLLASPSRELITVRGEMPRALLYT